MCCIVCSCRRKCLHKNEISDGAESLLLLEIKCVHCLFVEGFLPDADPVAHKEHNPTCPNDRFKRNNKQTENGKNAWSLENTTLSKDIKTGSEVLLSPQVGKTA